MRDRRMPINASTVTINGYVYSSRNPIWAGLRLAQAKLVQLPNDPHLSVPWCHIDEQGPACTVSYRLRSIDPSFNFVRARNRAWVLRWIDDRCGR
jgi:hypothetical protein